MAIQPCVMLTFPKSQQLELNKLQTDAITITAANPLVASVFILLNFDVIPVRCGVDLISGKSALFKVMTNRKLIDNHFKVGSINRK